MSFLTNLFGSLKGATPTNAGTSPRTNGDDTSNGTDEDWEFVTAHEAGVIYHDRITILLGPHRETRYHILIAKMPKSSQLLNHMRTLDPSHRHGHLFFPDLPMVKSYLNSLSTSVGSLAIEESWSDIIKLAITADVFQDSYMEERALAALKQKGIVALAPGNAVLLFTQHGFAFAQEYNAKTGNGKELVQTLYEVADTLKSELSKPQDMRPRPRPEVSKWKSDGAKYSNSVLGGWNLARRGAVKQMTRCTQSGNRPSRLTWKR